MRFILIGFLYLLSSAVVAQNIIIANTHWPPWRMLQKDGTLSGIEIDILQQLSASLQLNLISKGCGWNRCLKYMEVGESDIMSGLYKTTEREQYMAFIEPPYRISHGTCFYQNKNSKKIINSYQDLQKIIVGVVKKVSYFDQFDHDYTINKYISIHDINQFRLLERNRIDAVAMNCIGADMYLKDFKGKNSIKRAPYIYKKIQPVYFAISKKSPLLPRKQEFSNALQNMLDKNEVENIMQKYGITAQ